MNLFLIIGLFLLGMLSISLVSFFTGRKLRGRFASNEVPVSVNVFRGSHLISLALLTEKIALPFGELTNILRNSWQGWDLLIKQGIYLSLFFAIILVVYLVLSWVAAIAFSLMAKGGRLIEEAIEGNISNIMLFAGIQIALVIVVRGAIPDLLSVLIPYPNLPGFH
ncbi:MAG: hypothetical protein J0M29_00380 [Chitinophagales bacterium]|nr:hypothetical protein [Chitinophagales bacterium]